jgi:peptidoglycan/xylan/chitin deacetylase (PgdA/CDA1 family)
VSPAALLAILPLAALVFLLARQMDRLPAAPEPSPSPAVTSAPAFTSAPALTPAPTPEPTPEPTPTPHPTPLPDPYMSFDTDLVVLTPGKEATLNLNAENTKDLPVNSNMEIRLEDGRIVGWGKVAKKKKNTVKVTLPESLPPRTTLYLYVQGSELPIDMKDVAVIDRNYEQIYGNYSRDDKMVAFTFDCAYGEVNTDWILDTLKEYNIHVTFFMTGGWIGNHGPWIERMIEEGHEIGNHSMTHPNLNETSDKKVAYEIAHPIEMMLENHGYRMHLFRCPYGKNSPRVSAIARFNGCETIKWGQTSKDATDGWTGKKIIDLVLKELQPGDIILCHNGAKEVRKYLRPILDELIKRGYTFGTVSELMGWEGEDTYTLREQRKAEQAGTEQAEPGNDGPTDPESGD